MNARRDLLVENIRDAAVHEEPMALTAIEVAVLNAELERLAYVVGHYRAEAQRLQRIVDGAP